MLALLDRLSGWLARCLLAVGCVFLGLMMLHVAADVGMRFVFNRPIVGTLETVSYYYMIFAVFLPLAYVERRHEHIKVDLFTQFMPNWLQVLLYAVACGVGIVFFSMLAYQSYLDAVRATTRAETIMANFLFYVWPARWALPIGFGAIVLMIAVNLLKALARRRAL